MTVVRSRRILIVDNDTDFRDSVELLLQARGYMVFATGTRLEAMEIARQERVHIAVLDVRMESDPDHDDISGLMLARQLDPLIVKIMVTAYPSVPVVLGSHDVAFKFVGKDELPGGLLRVLTQAYADQIKMNLDLVIRWEEIQVEEVAHQIDFPNKPGLAVMQAEIEEVLCRLFYEANEITVMPLISANRFHSSSSSPSGAVVLKVTPRERGGQVAPVVVKLASREMIEAESRNYDQYVEGYLGGYRHTLLREKTMTHLLGGIIYSLVGTPLEECVDFSVYYTTRTANEIIPALTDLFTKTCRHWYENRETEQEYDLVELYTQSLKLSTPRLENALRAAGLAAWADDTQPWIPELRRPIHNPVEWFRQHAHLTTQISLALTHGDLHSQNMLFDPNHQAWLIDFYRSGPGHFFRDLIELESDIKFVLLDVADFLSLYQFEQALLSTRYFDDMPTQPTFQNAELRKAFEVVQGIRHIAGRLAGQRTGMLDYYQGLLLQTLAMICLRHVSLPKKRHAYLAASLLCQRLDSW
jgi:CheY-like chemotaxis protein